MGLQKGICERGALREYTDRAGDHEVIDRRIGASAQSLIASNPQPWTFTMGRDQRKLDALSSQTKVYMLARHNEMVGSSHFQMLKRPRR
jgi:hypothetical protein